MYSFAAGWSNGNLNIRLMAQNIFNGSWLRYTRNYTSSLYLCLAHQRDIIVRSAVASEQLFFKFRQGYAHLLDEDEEVVDEVAGLVGEAVFVAVDSLDH